MDSSKFKVFEIRLNGKVIESPPDADMESNEIRVKLHLKNILNDELAAPLSKWEEFESWVKSIDRRDVEATDRSVALKDGIPQVPNAIILDSDGLVLAEHRISCDLIPIHVFVTVSDNAKMRMQMSVKIGKLKEMLEEIDVIRDADQDVLSLDGQCLDDALTLGDYDFPDWSVLDLSLKSTPETLPTTRLRSEASMERVFVRYRKKKTTILLESTASSVKLGELKEMIEAELHIEPADQLLYNFVEKLLQDDCKTLGYYNIQNGSTLSLLKTTKFTTMQDCSEESGPLETFEMGKEIV